MVLQADHSQHTLDLSPDGRLLLYGNLFGGQSAIWVLPLDGSEESYPYAQGEDFSTWSAQFSPDGRWVAYSSDETGRYEVFVAPFPGPGRKMQVSSAGGFQPRWRRDGRELFFASADGKLIAVDTDIEGERLVLGENRELFDAPQVPANAFDYLVSADGQRFLFNAVAEDSFEPITLVVNWTEELNP